MLKPSFASSSQNPLPIPSVAPVTNAQLPYPYLLIKFFMGLTSLQIEAVKSCTTFRIVSAPNPNETVLKVLFCKTDYEISLIFYIYYSIFSLIENVILLLKLFLFKKCLM